MRKRLFSIAICFAMLLSLLPTTALAAPAEYGVWVNGVQFNENNATIGIRCGGGSATLDTSTFTVTLNNATISQKHDDSDGMVISAGIFTTVSGGITINLQGSNKICFGGSYLSTQSKVCGIYSRDGVAFTGNGDLDVSFDEFTDPAEHVYGIYGKVHSLGDENGITLSAKGASNPNNNHSVYGGVNETDRTLKVGNNADGNDASVWDNQGYLSDYAYLQIAPKPQGYGIYVAGVEFTSENLTIDSTDSSAITAGSATYVPADNKLTLNGLKLTATADAGVYGNTYDLAAIYAKDSDHTALEINLIGENSIDVNAYNSTLRRNGIYISNDGTVEFTGSGLLNAVGYESGISVYGVTIVIGDEVKITAKATNPSGDYGAVSYGFFAGSNNQIIVKDSANLSGYGTRYGINMYMGAVIQDNAVVYGEALTSKAFDNSGTVLVKSSGTLEGVCKGEGGLYVNNAYYKVASDYTNAAVWYGDSKSAAEAAGAKPVSALQSPFSTKYFKIAPGTPTTDINCVTISGVQVPAIGQNAGQNLANITVTADPANAIDQSRNHIWWWNDSSSGGVDSSESFAAETKYWLNADIYPAEGYTLTNNTQIVIKDENGNTITDGTVWSEVVAEIATNHLNNNEMK